MSGGGLFGEDKTIKTNAIKDILKNKNMNEYKESQDCGNKMLSLVIPTILCDSRRGSFYFALNLLSYNTGNNTFGCLLDKFQK